MPSASAPEVAASLPLASSAASPSSANSASGAKAVAALDRAAPALPIATSAGDAEPDDGIDDEDAGAEDNAEVEVREETDDEADREALLLLLLPAASAASSFFWFLRLPRSHDMKPCDSGGTAAGSSEDAADGADAGADDAAAASDRPASEPADCVVGAGAENEATSG